jgi:hypothetical protein
VSDGFGIVWRASFRNEDEPGLVMRESPTLIDALAKTPLWPELQVYAAWSGEGKAPPATRLGTLAPLEKLVAGGQTLYFARGDGDALRNRDQSDMHARRTRSLLRSRACERERADTAEPNVAERHRARRATLLAPSRDGAIALAAGARGAGYDRVVYRDENGKLWDPQPPGEWITD